MDVRRSITSRVRFHENRRGVWAVAVSSEEIYRSANGDRWRLIRDDASGRVFVRHEANLSSGGHVTDTDVDDFLAVAGPGPEYAALRRLLDGRRDDA
jgi:hypothetical protein